MSVIFGICNLNFEPADQQILADMASATNSRRYDGSTYMTIGHVGMGIHAFHTAANDRLGSVPQENQSGNLIVFDGRLDNRSKLIVDVATDINDVSDGEIVLKLFARWGR